MTALPMDPSMLPPSMQMPGMPKPKGGMFGGKGAAIGEAIAAAISGYLAAGGNPAGLAGLQMLHQRRSDAARAQHDEDQYTRQRSDRMSDWMAQQQYSAAHPESRAPHYFESNSGDQYTIGPDGKPQEVFHDPMRYKFVPNGMGGVVPVDIGALMGGQAPQRPVGKLTPIDEGGPMPSASGGFPRPY